MSTKVLVFGSLNIDLTFSVDHIVRPGETISSNALYRSAGGKGANQAAASAKASAKATSKTAAETSTDVYMAGKIGPDGEFLVKTLESYGVNTEHIARYDGATGQAIIQLEKTGQNSIVLFAGGNGEISSSEVDTALNHFGAGDIVLLQNEIVRTAEIMEGAKKRGMKVFFNPSPFNEKVYMFPLDKVDCFFVNEIEGAALASGVEGKPVCSKPALNGESRYNFTAILDKLTRRFPQAEIVLTAGEEGAWYGCGSVKARGDAVKVTAVDTVGAGDTFTGYFIAARLRDFPVEDSLAIACKAAAVSVSRKGAMEAIPFWDEVVQG